MIVDGLRTNQIPGKLQIYVTASYHGLRARTLITQFVEAPAGTNAKVPQVQPSKSSGKWKWVVLGVAAGAGAGAGIYFGLHGSSPSPISIGTGPVTFGERLDAVGDDPFPAGEKPAAGDVQRVDGESVKAITAARAAGT